MPVDSTVETLHVIKNIRLGVLPGGVNVAFDSLFLQAAEERFGNRIIPTESPGTRGDSVAHTLKFTIDRVCYRWTRLLRARTATVPNLVEA